MLDDPDTVAAACSAGVDHPVCRPCALALLADLLLVPLELCRAPVVKVSEGDAHFHLDVGSPSLAGLVAKVTTPAKEAAEEIEGVVVVEAAALLALLEAFVAVLVVYLAGFGVNQGLVGLGYLDELLLYGIIAGVLIRVVFLGELPIGRLDLLVVGMLVEAEDLYVGEEELVSQKKGQVGELERKAGEGQPTL